MAGRPRYVDNGSRHYSPKGHWSEGSLVRISEWVTIAYTYDKRRSTATLGLGLGLGYS